MEGRDQFVRCHSETGNICSFCIFTCTIYIHSIECCDTPKSEEQL